MSEVSTERLRGMRGALRRVEYLGGRITWYRINEVELGELMLVVQAELKRREEFERRCWNAAYRIKECHSEQGRYNIVSRSMTEPLAPEIEEKWLRAARAAAASIIPRATPHDERELAKDIRDAVEGK